MNSIRTTWKNIYIQLISAILKENWNDYVNKEIPFNSKLKTKNLSLLAPAFLVQCKLALLNVHQYSAQKFIRNACFFVCNYTVSLLYYSYTIFVVVRWKIKNYLQQYFACIFFCNNNKNLNNYSQICNFHIHIRVILEGWLIISNVKMVFAAASMWHEL